MVMSLFYLIAVLLIAIASGLAIYPLLKTQRKLALVLIIGLPLLTFSLYRFIGTPEALDPVFMAKNKAEPSINDAIAGLEQELKNNPDNAEGWVLLARTRMAMGDFEAANQAFKNAIELTPKDPDLKTERAEALMRASNDRSFPDEAISLLKQVLSENPDHQRALFYIGLHFLQQGDLKQSEIYLNRLLPQLDAKAANALREQINIARAQKDLPPLEMAAVDDIPAIKLTISLDPALAATLKPGAVLFVFAKSLDEKGPPVAAKRIDAVDFPIQIELSDADSLMPTAKLSSQEKVVVSARISNDGEAFARTGDIEADTVVVETKSGKPSEIKLLRVKQ